MIGDARRWRILAGGVAAGMAGVLGLAGTIASAEPVYPYLPQPAPAPHRPGDARRAAARPPPRRPSAPSSRWRLPASSPPRHLRRRRRWCPPARCTLHDYFGEKGVKLEPQVARDFKALNIVLPVPRGWSQVPDPNVPDAFAVLADRVGGDGIYTSNAALVVYKLVGGDFDPKDAITHGYIDSQMLPAWRTTKASLADFGGMPSAMIEGSYRDNNMSLNTARRNTIAVAGHDKYLVSLSVTTTVGEAVPTANATEAITNGFKISAPGAPAARSIARAPRLCAAAPR